MKKTFLLAILLLPLLIATCKKEDRVLSSTSANKDKEQIKNDNVNSSGHIKIAVLSDVHYMDRSLFTNGAGTGLPFQTYLMDNPNKVLQAFSADIFEKVLDELRYENPNIILIAGDMTKDGEKVSHDQVAILLHQLQNANRKVFVVPGNNDINNTTALGYNGNHSYSVSNIPPSYFSTVYSDFGYNGTDRDPNSLSYLVKPYPGLWILGIDAVKYAPKVSRSGVIKSATMEWIKTQLQKAKDSNAVVFGLMHHNLIEHFDGQSGGAFTSTVVDNWRASSDSLSSWGLKIIFTGHNHSTDIAERDTLGRTLYDIETGSLVTAPTSYMILELKNKELDISTIHVKSIGSVLPDSVDFQTYSREALIGLLDQWFPRVLQGPLFSIPSQFAAQGTPLARNAYMAHMAGDEKISPQEQVALNNYYGLVSNMAFENTINSLWTDNGVKDLKWHIKLTNP